MKSKSKASVWILSAWGIGALIGGELLASALTQGPGVESEVWLGAALLQIGFLLGLLPKFMSQGW